VSGSSFLNRIVIAAALVIVAPLTTSPASAASYIVMDIGTDTARHESTAWIDGNRVALTQSNVDGFMFFDEATGTVTIVDHAQKSFMRMDEAKIEKLVGMASGVMGAMAAAMESLKNLPEAQRKAAEEMMASMGMNTAGGPGAKKEIVATDELRNVNGVSCKMHNIMNNGASVSQACIATASQTGIPATDWKTVQSMRNLWLKFADRATPLIEKFGAGLPDISAVGADGLPVMVIRGGKPEMMIRTIGQGKTPAGILDIPAGYREKNLPLL